MAAITLTPQDGSASVVVNTNIIYRVFAYNGGSKVMYGIGGAVPYEMTVTQTPAAIAASCNELILVTTSDGAEYIFAGNSANGDGKGVMVVQTWNTTGSLIFFKYTEQSTPTFIYSTDSKATIASRINTILPLVGSVENVAASGALSVSAETSMLNTTSGALALTLADGLYDGQLKFIICALRPGTNNAVVTVANLRGGTTATFNATTDALTMVWSTAGGHWVISSNVGVVIA
jgi:hypothetical protein